MRPDHAERSRSYLLPTLYPGVIGSHPASQSKGKIAPAGSRWPEEIGLALPSENYFLRSVKP